MDRSQPLPSRSSAAHGGAPAPPPVPTEAFVTAWADFSHEDDHDIPAPLLRRASHHDETYLTAWSDFVDVTINITDANAPAVELDDAPAELSADRVSPA